jgi:hypothetical protein
MLHSSEDKAEARRQYEQYGKRQQRRIRLNAV